MILYDSKERRKGDFFFFFEKNELYVQVAKKSPFQNVNVNK